MLVKKWGNASREYEAEKRRPADGDKKAYEIIFILQSLKGN